MVCERGSIVLRENNHRIQHQHLHFNTINTIIVVVVVVVVVDDGRFNVKQLVS